MAYRVRVHRDLPVPMPDGVVLLADRYEPVGAGRAPVVLIRSPYGRRGAFGWAYGRGFARHGFQVVLQSCRGGFGSGGRLDPLGDEHDDGLATLEWMRGQSWYGGAFAMHGPSYLGYTQWAVAPWAGPDLRAMAVQISASQFRDAAYVGGAFALESTLSWTTLTDGLAGRFGAAAPLTAPRMTRRAVLSGRPVAELDLVAAGKPLPFFRDLVAHHADPATPYWGKRDFSAAVAEVEAPVSMLGGWYDVFLPWQLKDYLTLRRAGRRPRLTIGPWYHVDVRHGRHSFADALTWFRAHLLGDPSGLREPPVRLHVTGAGEWRDYPDWPVPGMRAERWHLQPGFGLSAAPPEPAGPDRYRYHPAHPTPVIGGPALLSASRPRDQRRLEARRDVLVYSSEPLRAEVEAIGPVSAQLYVGSSTPYVDVVVRVCDVHPDGRSMNVCEGVRRLSPADGSGHPRRVEVELWPIGHRFGRGHRIRVHVASGAYPTIARNFGTGGLMEADMGAGMVPADVEVFHSPAHPSAIVLPRVA
ncbi:CocE/NonD family hydrolase [Thermoactinospora rubra]|uniref:CocE/NonD family hydrolase n=1 Tax=Thermoactinospora rubra TaxID=1088767 RepID=UPI00197E5446|nr:CocE/NonD family hydrolase [Thermoactinospora rubra]